MVRSLLAIFAVLFASRIAASQTENTLTLDTCIGYFMDGEYEKAADSIKAVLPLISDRRQEAEAYKYLGFSYVMLDLIKNAKEYFRVALEKFPQMEIDTLEVPPNIAIVFKQTKFEVQMDKGEILDKKHQERRENRTVVATILGAGGLLSGAAGGYYFYKGYKSRRDYHAYEPPENQPPNQGVLDAHYAAFEKNFRYGGIAASFACIEFAASVYFFIKKAPPPKKPVAVIFSGDRIEVCLSL